MAAVAIDKPWIAQPWFADDPAVVDFRETFHSSHGYLGWQISWGPSLTPARERDSSTLADIRFAPLTDRAMEVVSLYGHQERFTHELAGYWMHVLDGGPVECPPCALAFWLSRNITVANLASSISLHYAYYLAVGLDWTHALAWGEYGQARWGWFLFERIRSVVEAAGVPRVQIDVAGGSPDLALCGESLGFVQDHYKELFVDPGRLEDISVECVASSAAPSVEQVVGGASEALLRGACAPARATVLLALALRSIHLDTMPAEGGLLQVPLGFMWKLLWAGQNALLTCGVLASSFRDLVLRAPLAWGILASLGVALRHVDPAVPERIAAMNLPGRRRPAKVRFGLCEDFTKLRLPQGRIMTIIAADVFAPYEVTRGYAGDWDGPPFLELAVFIWHPDVLVDFATYRRLTDKRTRTARNFDTDRVAMEWGFLIRFESQDARPVACMARSRLHQSSRLRCPIPRTVRWGRSFSFWLLVEVGPEASTYTSSRVDICAEERLREEVLLCVDPLYRIQEMERRWPGHFHRWVDYHLAPLGSRGRMLLYDLDGSAKDLVSGVDRLHYVDNFETRMGLPPTWELCPDCVENLAYDHCLFKGRGTAKWIAVVHGPDTFIASGKGPTAAGVLDLVRQQKANIAILLLAMVHFDGDLESNLTTNCANSVIRAFTWRRKQPDYFRAQVVVRPRTADYIDGHRAWLFEDVPWPQSQRVVPIAEWRANHYGNLFRSRAWDGLGERVPDTSMCRAAGAACRCD